jgi:hypothetical protein
MKAGDKITIEKVEDGFKLQCHSGNRHSSIVLFDKPTEEFPLVRQIVTVLPEYIADDWSGLII